MAGVLVGRIGWGMSRDDEGHRDYFVRHRVRTELNEGPVTAFNTPGLPLTGDFWNFGDGGGDNDIWATATPFIDLRVDTRSGQKENEPGRLWIVTNKFTTKPRSRCQDETIEDPLLEPPKVSGSFTKRTKEAFFERADKPVDPGKAILSSSHERLFLEVDDNRPTVTIGQNVASLGLELFSAQVDTVNDATLWGLATRKVKLSNVSWSRNYWGICDVYYTRNFEFDINFKTFDEDLRDEGTMKLKDGGNKTLIADYVVSKDIFDENTSKFPLDGNGNIAATVNDAATITPEYYPESNFLLLGIPTVL